MLDPHAEFSTERLTIRPVSTGDVPALIAFAQRNREHLRRWEPATTDARIADVALRQSVVAGYIADARDDRGYRFLARLHGADAIAASVNLNMVARGVFQACTLGYSVDAEHQGTGLAREAVARVVRIAFEELGLHRVMANHMPSNARSARLLQALGFEREGLARTYLQIDGAWEDHVLNALVRPESAEVAGSPA